MKQLALALIDAGLVSTALALSVYLRFDWRIPTLFFNNMVNLLLPAVIFSLVIFFLFGLYRRVWRYASIDDLLVIVVAVSLSSGAIYLYSLYQGILPRSSYIIMWFLLLFLIGGSRLSIRLLVNLLSKPAGKGQMKKVLIIGAGEAGALVAKELKKHGSNLSMKLVGYIDDDQSKQKQIIQGLPVIGTRHELPQLIMKKGIDAIIIAMPSAPYSSLQEIVNLCEGLEVEIKTVPGIYEILEGQVSFNTLKEVEIEDLLRRLPVKQDMLAIAAYLTGLTVMVTGAGGSIGSELCRQIASLNPEKLVLLDHNENGIFYTHLELSEKNPRVEIVPLVCDIKDHAALEKVFLKHQPQVIFHAAAHKHVPLMELNREEAIRNNVHGSKNMIDLASLHGVKKFVSVSTDKAVNPTSVMGVTKRLMEIYLQEKARSCNSCVYCSVRFGNVLGSQGSVVLLFKEQIARGGPVTVTDPEMKRYFMTIPEAVQLVIQAGALGKGGEIFVLDMGEPVKIINLARDMIILSGLKPELDIKIKIIGLRPGEKLYEELFSDRENFAVTRHERIFVAPDTNYEKAELDREVEELLKKLGNGDLAELLGLKSYSIAAKDKG